MGKKILLPKYFIEDCGVGMIPLTPGINVHLCSQGPRNEREQDEGVEKEGNGKGCFPPQLTTGSEGAS